MAIQLKQQMRLSQQLIMTPQLQMAIKLLQLSRLELLDQINLELEQNPALEEAMETLPADRNGGEPDELEEPVSPDSSEILREVKIDENAFHEIDWSNYLDESASPGRMNYETESREAPRYESFIARKESLNDHLRWQLLMSSSSETDQHIGSLIIGNLDPDGYLKTSVEEIAESNGLDPNDVTRVLVLLQGFDPPGICARDLRECLLIQIEQLHLNDSVVAAIIRNHIKHLENKNYKIICRDLKISMKEALAAIHVIKQLEPKPGRIFTDEQPHYINPDIYVYKLENEFVIMLNDDGMPRLKINPYYKEAMSRNGAVSGKTRDYLQEKIRSASWLIRSIHQRQKTIYKVMESILNFQYDFFEHGIAHLKPMVLRDVAEDIDMHESTISRVTTNKYALTPQGIFELKFFFNSSIHRSHGGVIASASVQEKIKKIIENENPRKPYSDDRIVKILEADNIHIARRTVAKYREMMGLLSSNKRKQL